MAADQSWRDWRTAQSTARKDIASRARERGWKAVTAAQFTPEQRERFTVRTALERGANERPARLALSRRSSGSLAADLAEINTLLEESGAAGHWAILAIDLIEDA